MKDVSRKILYIPYQDYMNTGRMSCTHVKQIPENTVLYCQIWVSVCYSNSGNTLCVFFRILILFSCILVYSKVHFFKFDDNFMYSYVSDNITFSIQLHVSVYQRIQLNIFFFKLGNSFHALCIRWNAFFK